jgi:hypothetical protein
MTAIPHASYSPHKVQCDFFLFPKLKMMLGGRSFKDATMIQAKSQDTLSEFQTDFWKCLEWQRSC